MALTNRQVLLAARPSGYPKQTDFRIVEIPVPKLQEGQFLVRLLYLSVDPYMRGRMRKAASYAPSLEIGDLMIGGAVGEVIESRNPDYHSGEIVEGMFGWQEYAVAGADTEVRKIDPSLAPISTALGVLGMPGLTAYFGLLEIGRPRPGETVLVSGAAGAVGSVAGQIAKIRGCRVVGIAGSDEKVGYLTEELGFDAAFNYKTSKRYGRVLAELCPGGIDVYFDNVGGAITDAAFAHLKTGARIAVCGQISQYNLEKPELGPRLLWHLIVKQARAEGFLVFQFKERYQQGLAQLARWVREGKIRYREQVAEGLENAPSAFIGMLRGANIGKQLVKVADLAGST